MLTIACVLRSGGIYTTDWVEKLQRGVATHLSADHRFVCLSDMDVPCERIELAEGWPGWWSKVEIFRPGLLTGRTIYFDLDTLIVGPLDAIAAHPHKFTMCHEFYRPEKKCSTAMAWSGDHSRIWLAMKEDPAGVMAKYAKDSPEMRRTKRIGDQAFIEDAVGVRIETFRDLFGEKSIASFKVHAQRRIPDGAAAVAFHGLPKPAQAGGWAQAMWETA